MSFDLYRALRVAAHREGKPIAAVIRDILDEALQDVEVGNDLLPPQDVLQKCYGCGKRIHRIPTSIPVVQAPNHLRGYNITMRLLCCDCMRKTKQEQDAVGVRASDINSLKKTIRELSDKVLELEYREKTQKGKVEK